MYDNYNYPMGADTHDAPWNEERIPEREFDIEACATMKFKGKVTTDDYTPIYDDEDGSTEFDTNETDWRNVFDNNYYGIQGLLHLLKEYAEKDLKASKGFPRKECRLRRIIEECDMWQCEDFDVYEQ